MSDVTPNDDDLMSAYLDDEVSASERARIEADGDSMARVAELRVVRDAVAAPVTSLDEVDRDRLIATALAASETSPTVTSMTVARARRTRSWRPLIAVAAAVAAIAIAVPILRNTELGGDSTTTAGEAATDSAADEPASEAAEAAPAADLSGGDDDSAGDGAVAEEAEAQAAPAATMGAEAAAEEPADEPASGAADEPAEGPVAADRLVDLDFEPMVPDLGPFQSIDQIIDRAHQDYEAWLLDPQAANSVAAELDEQAELTCLDELGFDVDQRPGDDIVAPEGSLEAHRFDIAGGDVAGTEHVIWLLEDGTVYAAPTATCSPVVMSNPLDG